MRREGRFWIGEKQVTESQFKKFTRKYNSRPLKRGLSVRSRKRAILAAREWVPCFHDFEFRSDWEGDPGVVNGTHTVMWLECACGA